VSTDLARFSAINPCGFDASVMTSMARELGSDLELSKVKTSLVGHVAQVFDRGWQVDSDG
jgi:lipoate-protein ligase B